MFLSSILHANLFAYYLGLKFGGPHFCLSHFSQTPNCLNGGGPCGDSSSLDFFAGPQAEWTAGSIVPITVVVTAHHMGHYEFRVCDQVLNSSVADADACLNKWVLERATPEEAAAAFGLTPPCSRGDSRPHCVPFDANHPERWYLPPRGEIDGTHTVYFKVPAGLQCDACTLHAGEAIAGSRVASGGGLCAHAR